MKFGQADLVAGVLARGMGPNVEKIVRFQNHNRVPGDEVGDAIDRGIVPPDVQAALKKKGLQLIRAPEHDEAGEPVTFVLTKLVS